MINFFNKVATTVLKSYKEFNSLNDLLENGKFDSTFSLERFSEINNNKPYKYNVWTYACINAIKRPLITVPNVIYDTRLDKYIDKHPVLDLLKKPNSQVYGTGLKEMTIVNMLIDGQVWLLTSNILKEVLGEGQIPKILSLVRDCYIRPSNPDITIQDEWIYTSSGQDIRYKPSQLIRYNFYNPYNPNEGLAPLDAAYISIQNYGKIAGYNANFLKNGAALSGIIEIERKLKDEEKDKLRKEFKQKHSGEDKAGSVGIFDNGMKYNTISSSHRDMEFVKQYEFNKEETLAAFGVPKNMVSDYADQNYSNTIAADENFWKSTLIPLDHHINEALTYQWLKGINPDWELRSDYSGVEALNNVPKEKVEAYEKLVSNGVTRREAARVLNIPIDWKEVEKEERENDAKDEKKRTIEEERLAAQAAQNQNSDQDQDENFEEDEKFLCSSINKFFTRLRNDCMKKVDKNEDVKFDVEKESTDLRKMLDFEVYMPIIKNFLAISKEMNGEVKVTSVDIARVLNSRAQAFKEVLEIINKNLTSDKTEIQHLFQEQHAKNKEIAKDEIEKLYAQIVRANA